MRPEEMARASLRLFILVGGLVRWRDLPARLEQGANQFVRCGERNLARPLVAGHTVVDLDGFELRWHSDALAFAGILHLLGEGRACVDLTNRGAHDAGEE